MLSCLSVLSWSFIDSPSIVDRQRIVRRSQDNGEPRAAIVLLETIAISPYRLSFQKCPPPLDTTTLAFQPRRTRVAALRARRPRPHPDAQTILPRMPVHQASGPLRLQ